MFDRTMYLISSRIYRAVEDAQKFYYLNEQEVRLWVFTAGVSFASFSSGVLVGKAHSKMTNAISKTMK